MVSIHRTALLLALIPVTALIDSCGGGGGGGGATVGSSAGGTSKWGQGQFSPAATSAAMCVSPRTGIDPATGKAYLDRPGTALDEKNWLRSWTNDFYLWFSEVPDQDPAGFASDAAFFEVLRTSAASPAGKPKDRFHF